MEADIYLVYSTCGNKELHTYELPDIIAVPLVKGYKKFLQYIRDETS